MSRASTERLRIVAPASPFPAARFDAGLKWLAGLGLPIDYSDRIRSKQRYLAGPDAERLTELKAALSGSEAQLVIGARGGYGTMRLLAGLSAAPPIGAATLWGFSDLTALLCWAVAAGRPAVHGPVVTQLGDLNPASLAAVERLIMAGETTTISGELRQAGEASGPLIGGNLSLIVSLLGTPWAPNFDRTLLLLEDTNEPPYRIDRMLTQLRLAGVFDRIGGLLLGQFSGTDQNDLEAIVSELAQTVACPMLVGLPVGHGPDNIPLPLGGIATLDGNTLRIS